MTKAQKRIAILEKINSFDADREAALDAIPEELTDEDYCKAEDEIWKQYSPDTLATMWAEYTALSYKETRSDWFINFVQSFGFGQKTISRRQAEMFTRYADYDKQLKRYGVRLKDRYATMTIDRSGIGHITIKELLNI